MHGSGGPRSSMSKPRVCTARARTLVRLVWATHISPLHCRISPQVELLTSLEHGSAVRKVEFNMMGTCLAASTTGNLVHLWKPDFVGRWLLVSAIQGAPDAAEEGS